MTFRDIAMVTGKPGLYKVLKLTRNGMIVESLDHNKKKMIVSGNNKVSVLEEISIYTTNKEGTIALEDVIKKIFEKYNKKLNIDSKSSADEQKSFLEEIVPDFDQNRVYVSDIKKLIGWYQILVEFAPEIFKEEKKEEKEEKKEKPSSKKTTKTTTKGKTETKATTKKTSKPIKD